MFRKILGAGVLAGMLISPGASRAEGEAQASLAKPGENYVSMQVEGCADKCPSFEIYIFDTGRMTFRSNNQYTASKGVKSKSGMRSIYTRVSKYLQDTGALTQPAECTSSSDKTSKVIVQSTLPQAQKATWSTGCADQREKARSIAKVFVNQSGMWRLIHSDTRYWEKYWEDPAMTGRSDVAQ